MFVLLPPNTTCDIYRPGNSPPAPPDVANVKCYMKASNRHSINTTYHTHVLYLDATVDIRDGITAAYPSGGLSSNYDTVYIPDRNSNVVYAVAEVKRVGRGTTIDHKRVYLLRHQVSWPTNDL